MTTDPRLAPLIEALEQADAMVRRPADGTTRRRHRTGANYRRDFAATLLLLLPPDWCGHGDILDANNADIRDRDEALANIREAAIKTRAELARLRAIEEAARAVADESATDYGNRWDALRAALGSER